MHKKKSRIKPKTNSILRKLEWNIIYVRSNFMNTRKLCHLIKYYYKLKRDYYFFFFLYYDVDFVRRVINIYYNSNVRFYLVYFKYHWNSWNVKANKKKKSIHQSWSAESRWFTIYYNKFLFERVKGIECFCWQMYFKPSTRRF